jgi:cardiolipin synthase A/B
VIVQNGIGNGLLRYQRDLGTHDHCKLVVVDGRYAWVGGQNFAVPNEILWHGQQVRMEGPVAQDAQRIFVEHWTRAGGKARIGLPAAPPTLLGDVPAELLLRTPGVSDQVTLRHLEEIVKARTQILIATPQLHHAVIVEQLIAAAKRGVRVVVLVPEFNSDPQWMSREFLLERQNQLIDGGVEIYSYLPKPLDVKAATFDGRVAILGSAPLNGTSMDELMLCVPDARFTREVNERIMKPGLANSTRRERVSRGRLRRLKTRLFRAVNNRL